MNSNFRISALALAIAAGVAAPLSAAPYSQLAASAGLSQSEAAAMSLPEIVAHLFNRGESVQDRQTIPGEIMMGSAGAGGAAQLQASSRDMPGSTPREIAAIHSNQGESVQDRITVTAPTPGAGDRSQLIANAGPGIDASDEPTLTELAARHVNGGESTADEVVVRN